MGSISTKIKKALKEFVSRIEKEVSPEVVILYGSHAKGNAETWSDIDVAVFSRKFNKKDFVEITSYLFSKTSGLKVDLQPVGFPYNEYKKQNGEYLVELIKSHGSVIYSHGKFSI